jgi:hypothetical protein
MVTLGEREREGGDVFSFYLLRKREREGGCCAVTVVVDTPKLFVQARGSHPSFSSENG